MAQCEEAALGRDLGKWMSMRGWARAAQAVGATGFHLGERLRTDTIAISA